MLKTVVFPVAGAGSRMRPATRAVPKEMLTVVDRPLIQHAVEEALAAGARKLVFVVADLAREKLLRQHFSGMYPEVEWCYALQPEALGLGHAVLCARPHVDEDWFAVILPDELMRCPGHPALGQLLELHERTKTAVVGIKGVAADTVGRYGIVGLADPDRNEGRIHSIVEKPEPGQAPSSLALIGRYLLPARVFELLEHVRPGRGGEIQLTDALDQLIEEQEVHARLIEGERHDCGTPLGLLQAAVELGCRHPDIGQEFSRWLESRAP